MTTLATNRLFQLKNNLDAEEALTAKIAGFVPETTYWLVASRPSSLGGYLGCFETTYTQVNGVSPTGKVVCKNAPMRWFTPLIPL